MNPNSSALSEQLRSPEAWDYRSLLGGAIESLRETSGRAASFAALSSRFGFKSKSFLQHVLRGERHLSPESADRVARALKLDSQTRQIFIQLVRLAHLEEDSRETEAQLLRSRIRKLRSRRIAEAGKFGTKSQKKRLYADLHGPVIYAALGSAERGASIAEIVARTNLKTSVIDETIARWLEDRLVSEIAAPPAEKRYRAELPYVFDDSPEGHASVRDFYLQLAHDGLRAAESKFDDPQALFTAWAVSIDSRRMDELSARLKSLLLDFVVQSEDAEGDRVLRLSVAAF